MRDIADTLILAHNPLCSGSWDILLGLDLACDLLLVRGNIGDDRAVELFTNILSSLGGGTAFDGVHLAVICFPFSVILEMFYESSNIDAYLV